MNRIRVWCEFASKTSVLGVSLLTATMLVALVFPALPINGELLDAKTGYSHSDAVTLMESYGESGRKVYARSSLTLDTLLPVSYTFLLAGLIYRFRPSDGLWWLALLPAAGGVLDLFENVHVVLLLNSYPDVPAGLVARSSSLTWLKHHALSISVVGAATLASVSALVRIAGRLRGKTL
ncbi:MAG: hypothetical protein OXN89_05905 [Bryobacterales bacterium]|nr:hypothetical protein [Bryobacterales bacterium]